MKTLRLKRKEDRRIRAGHLWVYSNEVDTAATPLQSFDRGELAELQDANGQSFGTVYVNPNTLLCARLLSRQHKVIPDPAWFSRRLQRALALRDALYPEPFYRWVHGEADGLPGLVVDRFGDVLSVQVTTAGMEVMRPWIDEALRHCIPVRGIVWRDDAAARRLEALPDGVQVAGDVPETVTVRDNGIEFDADLRTGQKTGWYFDQRDNRARLARYAPGRRVLDLYSHAGAWALTALRHGAASALAVDSSAAAIEAGRRAAKRAGLPLQTAEAAVLDELKALRNAQRRFDLCIVDPPALIKRKKDFEAGYKHYVRVNHAAMQVLDDDAWLVSCSCSHHLSEDGLRKAVVQAAGRAGRRVQIVEFGGQSADHPVHSAMPETRYLNVLFCRVIGA